MTDRNFDVVCRTNGAMFPEYTASERLADGFIHVVGTVCALAAIAVLLIQIAPSAPALSVASIAVYGAGLLAMLGFSAGYNMVSKPNWKRVLRRLDHAAIFVMIAGTYTPFSLIAIGGRTGVALLVGVWLIALIGVAVVTFAPKWADKISIVIYLAQGWAILLVVDPLVASVSTRVLVLLAAGGILYTVGVLFHLWEKLPYHNAIWHLFVLLAAACHYWAVFDAVALNHV